MALTHQLSKKEKQALLKISPEDLDEQGINDAAGLVLSYFAKATKAERTPVTERTRKTYLQEFSTYADYIDGIMQSTIDELNAAAKANESPKDHMETIIRTNTAQGGYELYNLLTSLKTTVNHNEEFILALGYQINADQKHLAEIPAEDKESLDKAMTNLTVPQGRLLTLVKNNEAIANLMVYIATVTGISALNGIAKEWYQRHVPYLHALDPEVELLPLFYDVLRAGTKQWNGAIKPARSKDHIFSLMTPARAQQLPQFTFDQLYNDTSNELATLTALLDILGAKKVSWEDFI